jgi:hypothetical protein
MSDFGVIYKDGNDYDPRWNAYEDDDDSGAEIDAAGLTGFTVFLGATETATTPIGTLTASLAEYQNTPGFYHARFDGGDIKTFLANYSLVYRIITDGQGHVHGVKPIPVRGPREI